MDNYATHLPLLKKIGRNFNIRRIIEFGAGNYSTPLFLDFEYFPDVIELVSYETDRGWYESTKAAFSNDRDDRWSLRYSEQSLHEVVRGLYHLDYDLIFVDNGSTASERVLLLEVLNEWQPPSIIVVHDYEVREYQHSTRKFPFKMIYTGLVPNTAIMFAEESPYLKNWIDQ